MTHEDSIPVVNTQSSDSEISTRVRPLWIDVAFVFTLLFTAVHLYWALGGPWGLPLLAVHEKAAVEAVNWAVTVIMVIGASVILGLKHRLARRLPSWVLLGPIWAGAAVCISHSIYGFITKGLYLGGVHSAVDFPVVPGVSAATAAGKNHLSAVQDLLVFEPCFLIEGVLLAVAAWQFLRTPAGRRRWWVSLTVGVLAIDVFGTLLSLGGMHFAIS